MGIWVNTEFHRAVGPYLLIYKVGSVTLSCQGRVLTKWILHSNAIERAHLGTIYQDVLRVKGHQQDMQKHNEAGQGRGPCLFYQFYICRKGEEL